MTWLGICLNDLEDDEKEILENFSFPLVVIRIFHEAFGILLPLVVFVLYSSRYYFSTIYKYYSDIAMFFGAGVYFYCVFLSIVQIQLFHNEDPKLLSNRTKTRLRIMYRIRCALIFVLVCQLVMTCISFWVSYALDPNSFPELGLESYISHGIYLGYTLYYTFYITINPGIWALGISIGYTILYYAFVVVRRLIVGEWVYPGLDPSRNPYWPLIVFGMPFMQVLFFIFFVVVNETKNRFYAKICHYYCSIICCGSERENYLERVYVDAGETWKESMLNRLVFSSLSFIGLVLYSFVLLSCLHLHVFREYYLSNVYNGIGSFIVWIIGLDFFNFLLEFTLFGGFVWFWYHESLETTDENTPIEPPYIGKLLLLSIIWHGILLWVAASIIPILSSQTYTGPPLLGWYVFVRGIFSLLLVLSKSILWWDYELYKSGRPLQKLMKREPILYF